MTHSFIERLIGRRKLVSENISLSDAIKSIRNAPCDVKVMGTSFYGRRIENQSADGQKIAYDLSSVVLGLPGRIAYCTHKVYANARKSVEEHEYTFSVYDEINERELYVGSAFIEYVIPRSRFRPPRPQSRSSGDLKRVRILPPVIGGFGVD